MSDSLMLETINVQNIQTQNIKHREDIQATSFRE